MKLHLLTWPNKKLRRKCEKVLDFSEIPPIISNMIALMKKHRGAAIAAPQVGVLKRFFITDQHEVVINPSWSPSKNSSEVVVEEGCLSFPGIWVDVKRFDSVDVQYQDVDERWVEKTLKGFDAQVFQHETDHLNGVLFIDFLKR